MKPRKIQSMSPHDIWVNEQLRLRRQTEGRQKILFELEHQSEIDDYRLQYDRLTARAEYLAEWVARILATAVLSGFGLAIYHFFRWVQQ